MPCGASIRGNGVEGTEVMDEKEVESLRRDIGEKWARDGIDFPKEHSSDSLKEGYRKGEISSHEHMDGEGWDCPECGHGNWFWQKECSRCGHQM